MKAIDFVKKHGVEKASDCFNLCASPNDKWFIYMGDLISDKDFDDLEGIIDAFELVESRGGIDGAKKVLKENEVWAIGGRICVSPLEKAIKLVEQCR